MEIFISLKAIAACSSVQLQEPIDPPPAAAGNIILCQRNASRNQRILEATDSADTRFLMSRRKFKH
jgi:hypothetical protein